MVCWSNGKILTFYVVYVGEITDPIKVAYFYHFHGYTKTLECEFHLYLQTYRLNVCYEVCEIKCGALLFQSWWGLSNSICTLEESQTVS